MLPLSLTYSRIKIHSGPSRKWREKEYPEYDWNNVSGQQVQYSIFFPSVLPVSDSPLHPPPTPQHTHPPSSPAVSRLSLLL